MCVHVFISCQTDKTSGGSRPSAKRGLGGAFEGLTMNVEFCEDNSGSSKKMRYFRKNKGVPVPPLPSPGSTTEDDDEELK